MKSKKAKLTEYSKIVANRAGNWWKWEMVVKGTKMSVYKMKGSGDLMYSTVSIVNYSTELYT